MTTRGVFETAAAAVLIAVLAAPATAQFNPQFNHLKCYAIKDKPVSTKILLDNQFGRELVAKLTAKLLCVPTRKICCDTTNDTAGCQPIPCPPDPTPNQPAPVDHFKCYKIGVKSCTDATDAACTNTIAFKKINPSLQVLLRDQFTQEGPLVVGKPLFLCAPVTKIVIGSTTTTTATTTTTTTTTRPCQLDAANACAGDCPLQMKCLFQTTPPAGCNCVPSSAMCMLQSDGTCGGLCPKPTDICQPSSDPAVPCDCGPPSTATTTTTIPCRDVSQPGQPAMCAGDCPPTQGLQCVFIPNVGCHCEIACALNSDGTCNMQFCPKQGQQCIPSALNPCGCCFPPGAGPCASAADCCAGQCVASTCQ